ncbi:hypothetical protein GINT2_002132 [Glugoides intestinalis]
MNFESLMKHVMKVIKKEFTDGDDELIAIFRENYKEILLLLCEIKKHADSVHHEFNNLASVEKHKDKALSPHKNHSKFIKNKQALSYMKELRVAIIFVLTPKIAPESIRFIGNCSIFVIKNFLEIKKIPLKLLYTNNNLEILQFQNNNLSTLLPKMFSKLTRLKVLDLSYNNIECIPPGSFKGLESLEKLYITNNKLVEITEDMFEELDSLQMLYLRNNRIRTISAGAFNECEKLEELYMQKNKIVELPPGVFDSLEFMTILDFSHNKITQIDPELFKNCNSIQKLFLLDNKIMNLSPVIFKYLENLQILNLSSNRIKELPPGIFKPIRGLTNLDLSMNSLVEFPHDILSIHTLSFLDISVNQLKAIPKEIKNLKTLENVNMGSNNITELPIELKSLRMIELLVLVGNPVANTNSISEGGCQELITLFGSRLIYKGYITNDFKIVYKEDVYAALDRQPVHWNREKLKEIQVASIPARTLSDREILNIWKSDLKMYCNKSYEKHENLRKSLHTYLKVLLSRTDIPDNLVMEYNTTKDLLEYIFKKLRDLIPIDPDGVRSYLTLLAYQMLFCQTGKKEALDHIYAILSSTRDFNNIIGFIEHQIAVYKDMIFTKTVSVNSPQNVHVVNHWRNKMKKKLGLRIEYKDTIGTMLQDTFRNSDGNMLQSFYEKFTPQVMIDVLKASINQKEQWVIAATAFLMEKDEDMLKEYFEFVEEEVGNGITDFLTTAIKSEGVEQILLKLNILKRPD